MPARQSGSRFERFVAGPLGLAIALGFMVGFNSVFSRTSLGDRFATWVSWGFFGILAIVGGALGLALAGILLIIPLSWIWFFLKELWESRLLPSRDITSLRTSLAVDHPATRRAALRALGGKATSQEVAVREIGSFLSDNDETVAITSAESLMKLKAGAREAVPLLLQSLEEDKHRSYGFRRSALQAIKKIGVSVDDRRQLKALKGKINRWDDRLHTGLLNQILAQDPYDAPAKK